MKLVIESDTPEGVLKEMLGRAEHFESVMVIALNKDGSQYMQASHTSMINKCFLVSFAQSWVMRWFQAENE